MSFFPRTRATLLVGSLALTVAAAAGCGIGESGPSSTTGPSTSGAPTTTPATEIGSCDQAIPSSVVSELGWDDATSATQGRGGCAWEGDQGSIWVYGGPQDFQDTCEKLQDAAPDGTFEARLDNPAGLEACGYLRDDDLGTSEIVVVEAEDRVMTINLVASEPTSPDLVRSSMLALAGTTADVP